MTRKKSSFSSSIRQWVSYQTASFSSSIRQWVNYQTASPTSHLIVTKLGGMSGKQYEQRNISILKNCRHDKESQKGKETVQLETDVSYWVLVVIFELQPKRLTSYLVIIHLRWKDGGSFHCLPNYRLIINISDITIVLSNNCVEFQLKNLVNGLLTKNIAQSDWEN